MHLRRIEFLGFKSFAQKTVLDFPGGIAGIVGPNGSGKSNVIDGVRWVLGERDAKNLRGMKAEDLIFAGTPKRPRMGLAQVAMTFDNSSGFFPADFPEVTVMRRIDREGTSHYFLNKTEVRLKDIVDFFAQARLGTHGLAIVNQGNSDLFVKASPKERREMIEEILGLRQYQIKKHDAERKLQQTRVNLEKVRAMIEEIAPHLRFLKRQTAKWEKAGDVEKELRQLENIYYAGKLKDIHAGIGRLEPDVQRYAADIASREKELEILKAELGKIETIKPAQTKSQELRARRNVLLQERAAIERETGKLEVKIEFLNSVAASRNVDFRAGELVTALEEVRDALQRLLQYADIEQVRRDVQTLLQKISGLTSRSQAQQHEIRDVKAAKDILLKKLYPISEELNRLAAQEEASAQEYEHFNDDFRHAFENAEKKKDGIAALETARQKTLFEMEKLRYRRQDIEMQLSQGNRQIGEFERLINDAATLQAIASSDMAETERRMMRLRSELASLGDIDQALIKEATDTETRHAFLTQQFQDLDKAMTDLGHLIKELDAKIHHDFSSALDAINREFTKFFELMFGGGKASMRLETPPPALEEGEGGQAAPSAGTAEEAHEDADISAGIEVEVHVPRKKIKGLEMLSGGEKSLVSIAALFALISVSPPPFLVLDEVDAALDERNTKRFADLIRDFSKKTQFILVTHNRATMESADVLYGVTMEEDGVSKVLSLKLQ